MQLRGWAIAALAVVLAAPAAADAKTYKIDPEHTSVTFRVRHLFTYVEGRFREFDGTIEFDRDNPEATKVKGSIKVASIDTNVKERDEHLRSSDFFNVAEYPEITFESTKVTDVDKEKMTAKIHGNLTIRGVTKPVVIDAAFLGEAADPWGNKKAGFHGETQIDRRDFGLEWNKVLEAGRLLVGNDVRIRIDVEATIVE